MTSVESLWHPPPERMDLHAGVVDVWQFGFEHADPDLQRFTMALSDDERQRVDRLVLEDKKTQFTVCRGVLRCVLAGYLDEAPSALLFEYGEHGKPSLQDRSADLEFNLSHSAHLGLIGVAKHRRIGVDVDEVRRTTDWAKVSERVFVAHEVQRVLALPARDREQAYVRLWTCKEAYTKALGAGFQYGFKNFSVDPTTGRIEDAVNPQQSSDWSLNALPLAIPSIGTLVVEKLAEGESPPSANLIDFGPDQSGGRQ